MRKRRASPSRRPTSCTPRGIPAVERSNGSVTAGNSAAVHLYESAGFTRYGSLPRAIRIGERFLDKQLMQLNLR